MIDANKPMTVSLSAGAMNVVMQALYELPYKHAAPIIEELRRQILEAEPQAFDMAAAASAPRVNGIDPGSSPGQAVVRE
jgi:hypothetical protein